MAVAQGPGPRVAAADSLLLPDRIVAETVRVLEPFNEVPAEDVWRSPIRKLYSRLLLGSLEVYETHRIDHAEAYLTYVPPCALAQGQAALSGGCR